MTRAWRARHGVGNVRRFSFLQLRFRFVFVFADSSGALLKTKYGVLGILWILSTAGRSPSATDRFASWPSAVVGLSSSRSGRFKR